jgi:hypothetical protein
MPCSAACIPRSRRPEARTPGPAARPRGTDCALVRRRPHLDGRRADDEVRFDEATRFSADDARALITPAPHPPPLQRRGLLDEQTVDDMLTWQAPADS